MYFENLIDTSTGFQNEQNNTDESLYGIDIFSVISPLCEGGNISAVASRPGMGKTTMLCQIAINTCIIKNINCYYIFLWQESDWQDDNRVKSRMHFLANGLNFDTKAELLFSQCKEICIDELSSVILNEVNNGVVIIDGIERIKSPSYRRTISVLKSIADKKDIAIIVSSCLPRLFQSLVNKNTIADRVKYLSYFDNLLLVHREPFDFDNPEVADDIEIFMSKSELPTPIIMEYLCEKGYFRLKTN